MRRSQGDLVSLLIIISLTTILVSCSRETWRRAAQGAAQGMAQAGQPPVQNHQSSSISTVKLMIFGGEGHSIYLGCLTCSEYDSDSVFNKFGSYGSSSNVRSIWNRYGEYGSRFSSFSACNSYANDPPVIVDSNGNYYGRLTINSMRSDGPPTQEMRAWIASICQ